MVRPRQFSDEEILDATRAMLLEHGIQVSTTAIARQIGVSQAALFKRFGTKERLIVAALKPPMPPFVDLLEAGPDDRALEVQVKEIMNGVNAHIERIGPTLDLLRSACIDPKEVFSTYDEPPPVVANRALTAWLRRAKRRGLVKKSVDPASVGIAWLGMLHGRHFFSALDPSVKARGHKRYLKQVLSLLVSGIRAEDEE